METWAERVAVAVGVKVTSMVQLALALRLEPQALVWAKSPLLVPVMVMLVSVAVPGLVRVTACGALVVPSAWLPRAREAGMKLTAGCGADGGLPPPQPPRRVQSANDKRMGDTGPAIALFISLRENK